MVKWGAALCLLLLSRAALGDTAENRARALYKQGTTAFERKDYQTAVAKYEEAYALAPRPLFLYNIGLAYRLAGKPALAVMNLKQYLEKKPDAAERREVEGYIAELEKQIAAEEAAHKPPPPTPPPVEEVRTVPSPVEAAEAREPEPAPAPFAPSGTDKSRPIYKRWWFWAGVSAVAVGAVAAVVVLSSGKSDEPPPETPLGNNRIFTLIAH